MAGDAFLLGSGFSKALSGVMPTVADLKSDLVAFLGDQATAKQILGESMFSGADPEAILGYLAMSQPFLDQAENLERQALFVRSASWLAEYIFGRQQIALMDRSPRWWFPLFGKMA